MKLHLPSIEISLHGIHLSGRVARLGNRLVRAPYFRGHGVHSPYIYAIVREVFMRKTLMEGERTVYNLLIEKDVPERRAIQLQNLAIHCGYKGCGYDVAEGDLWIASEELPNDELLRLVACAQVQRHTVAVMNPYATREREALCNGIALRHPSTTVDNRGYLLIFNNHLPKQHFRI